jgi:hypothetical protein
MPSNLFLFCLPELGRAFPRVSKKLLTVSSRFFSLAVRYVLCGVVDLSI